MQAIRFGDWVWDPNTLELRKGAYVAPLEPRVARLLEYLVAHPGELLSHDQIVDAVWDGRIVSDEAVRRAVFNLRRALAEGGAEDYIRTIHKKGYVAAFPQQAAADRNGETPAVDATAFTSIEPAPLALKHAAPPVARSWRRPVAVGIIGALALVLAMLAAVTSIWQPEPTTTAAATQATTTAAIAVLPFTNLSDEAGNDFLGDGLAEELLGSLARNRGLRVTARSSAFQFKGQNLDAREIGQRLGVRYLLEGSVRRSGDQVRIHARLVDAETGTQLWGEAYERTLADWLQLQQDVALEVARALNFVLPQGGVAVEQPGETSNVEANLELLQARQLLATRSVADAEQAIEHLQRALGLDPNYALAYARLADAILIKAMSTTGLEAARPVVAPLLAKALALDPGLGEAFALRSLLTDDPELAARDLRRGLELNPSYARGYELLADLQIDSLKQYEQALRSIDNAIALDPLTPGNYHTKAVILMWYGDWAGAAALDRRALELNPNFSAALVQLGHISGLEGRLADSIGYIERAVALDPRAVPLREGLVLQYIAVGDIDGARAANTPPTRLGTGAILWAQGDIGQLAAGIYSRNTGPVEFEFDAQLVLIQALADRNFARALDLFAAKYPGEGPLPPSAVGWQLYGYANLVQLLALSGDAAGAARLEEKIQQRMRTLEASYPPHKRLYDHVRATLLAFAGQSEEACAVLERGISPTPGPRWGFVTSNPAFDGMRDTPCFKALLARAETHFAGERARVEAMRRDGLITDPSPPTLVRRAGAAP